MSVVCSQLRRTVQVSTKASNDLRGSLQLEIPGCLQPWTPTPPPRCLRSARPSDGARRRLSVTNRWNKLTPARIRGTRKDERKHLFGARSGWVACWVGGGELCYPSATCVSWPPAGRMKVCEQRGG